MAQSIELLTKKGQGIEINDDIFLVNDLSFEQKFLNQIVENFHKEIEDCKVSFHLSKKSMAICCEMSIMTETNTKKLLDIIDLSMEQHFFCINGLSQLGWCAHYMLEKRILNYCNSTKFSRKTELTEFYWFNNSPNRFHEQKTISQTEICNCMHCSIFIGKK